MEKMKKMTNLKNILLTMWYDIIVNPIKTIKEHLIWFFQKRIRGFDDREIWNLDDAFYKWLLIRLKRYTEKTTGYPYTYTSTSAWQKELVNRIAQLESLVKYSSNQFEFPYFEKYLTSDNLNKLKAKDMTEGQIKCVAFEKNKQNFNNWFAKNVNNLWC